MSTLIVVIQMTLISLVLPQEQFGNNLDRWSFIVTPVYHSSIPSSIPPWFQPNRLMARRDDYTYTPGIGGHKFHTRALTWNRARKTCEEEGAHLAIVNSIAEANVIEGLFNKSGKIVGGTGTPDAAWAFVGFHDLYEEGDYLTIDGQSLARAGYTVWSDTQPDNRGGVEHCGSVDRRGRLNDIICNGKYGFICELPI